MQISSSILVSEHEIEEQFFRSSGPGGQNVNKVATGVRVRFNISTSTSISEKVRARLLEKLGGRLDKNGFLSVTSSRFRSQWQNRVEARTRLSALLRQALKKEKQRKPTKPTKASKKRRLEKKKRQSDKKKNRKSPSRDD